MMPEPKFQTGTGRLSGCAWNARICVLPYPFEELDTFGLDPYLGVFDLVVLEAFALGYALLQGLLLNLQLLC